MSLIRKDLFFLTTNTLKIKKRNTHKHNIYTNGKSEDVVKPEPGAKDQGHRQDGWSAVALGVLQPSL